MKKSFLSIASMSLLFSALVGCSSNNNVVIDGVKLLSSIPQYQLKDHTNNYIDDNYKNYYQILVYSFYDSNDDGIGDINGIIEKLDYINDGNKNSKTSLGYDGIYLLPIFPSPTYHKYDATDYYTIDPSYGTLEDFDRLISECDKRGIDVILDLVVNHTSGLHPWFQTAINALKNITEYDPNTKGPTKADLERCPELNYYNFTQDTSFESEDGSIKNRYKVFSKLNNTNWYYEEQFKAEQGMPDLNLDSEVVQTEIYNIMKFWLDKGVKGFRLDATQHYYDESKIKNYEFLNKLNTWGKEITKNREKELFLVGEGPWSDIVSSYYDNTSDISFMNFNYGSGGQGKLVTLLNNSYLYNNKFEELTENGTEIKYSTPNDLSNHQFNILNNGANIRCAADYFKNIVTNWDNLFKSVSNNAIDSNFGVNHDTLRVVNQLSGKFSNSNEKELALKFYWAINNTLSGVTFNYYGEEIGMRAGSQGSYADPNKRHAFYWSEPSFKIVGSTYKSDKKGITDLPPGASPIEQYLSPADVQMSDPNSLWNFMRQINHMKVVFPEIARGDQEFIKVGPNYAVMKKTYNDSTIYLVYNFRMKANSIPLSELGLEEEPSEIKYSLSSSTSYFSNLTADSLNVPAYSITII